MNVVTVRWMYQAGQWLGLLLIFAVAYLLYRTVARQKLG